MRFERAHIIVTFALMLTCLLAGHAYGMAGGGSVSTPGGGGGTATPPPQDPSGDDLFLITSSASPNVILMMDNSLSMNQIEWHRFFDPEKTPDAAYCTHIDLGGGAIAAIDPNTTYTFTADTKLACASPARPAKTVWGPNNPTLWSGRYLMWYLGLSPASTALNEIENDVANVEGCTQAGGAKFFAEKYRRTRLEASKQVLLDLLCVAEPKNVRFGVAYYRDTEDLAGVDPNGGYVKVDLGRANPNHAAELEAAISLVDVNDDATEATPLAETYFQIYTFWMSRNKSEIPAGVTAGSSFPPYWYDKFGTWEPTNSTKWLEDALLFDCEKAFIVIVTDGLPTRDDFGTELTLDEAQGYGDILALVGDYHDEGSDGIPDNELPLLDPDEAGYLLDDLAKYAQDNDFRPDLGGDQVIDTYVVGLATDATTDAYLQMTADVGNGLFFSVQTGDQLAFALIAALNDIIEKSASFTAAAVPSARTLDGGDFYQSYFFPASKTAAWEGHIRAWKITALGDIIDKNGNCALDDSDAGECNSGPFLESAEYYWDAHEEVPQPAARTLYTTKLVSGTPTKALFRTRSGFAPITSGVDAVDLTIDTFTDNTVYPPDISPNDPLYQIFGSTAKNKEGLADEIIQFARGCFFATGVTDATLVQTPAACATRPSRFGDIFHSNPIVVRRPASIFLSVLEGASYNNFKHETNGYGARDRVIYAGTNGGFLEAIDAGAWQTSTQKYDEGSGAERWGFMSWTARQNIKHLPIDPPVDRTHYMDGSPQVADVWIYPSATATTKAINGSEWRTMLVTGMRRGGRQYLALDITNPNGIAGPGSLNLAYPGFEGPSGDAHGWEFPPEHDPDGWLPHMGFSWGQPILTRVKVTVNGGTDPVERWVAIVTAGYDENGDPNPDSVTGRVGTYDSNAIEGRGIFMIDLKTGEVLARKIRNTSASDAQEDLEFSIVGTPSVFDLNNDGFADLILVADLGGGIYKWIPKNAGGDPVNGSSASDDVDQPNWPFVKLFQAPVESISGDDHYQNFFTSAAAALVSGKLWIALGAGERKDLSYTGDSSKDENNRFYVLIDPDPYENTGLSASGPVTESDLIDATSKPGGVTITSERGFFIKAADGEKFVTNSVIFAGQVVTASFKPTPSADPCAARGEAKAYVFDLFTGEGYFTDDLGNPERTVDLGVGLPTDPRVSIGVGGGTSNDGSDECDDNRVYIEKSGADLESFGVPCVPGNGRLLYWREAE